MSIATENLYAPAPGAFPPTPRIVRLRKIPYVLLLLLFVFAAIGIGIFCASFGRLAMGLVGQWRGVTVEGKIADKTSYGRRGRHHAVVYTFRVDKEEHSVTQNVDDASFDRVNIGDAVQVRMWPVWPGASASIEDPVLAGSWNDVCFFAFVMVWDGFLIFAVWHLTRLRRKWRRLLSHGVPTLGVVTGKRAGKFRTVSYQFKTTDGAVLDGSMDVSWAAYQAIEIGQPITVMFDPLVPANNILYACGDYCVPGVG